MVYKEMKSFSKVLEEFIDKRLSYFKGIEVFVVTAVNPDTFTVNIKHPNFKKYAFSNVQVMSLGLGNFKGIMKLPSKDDLVIVGFLGKESNNPIVLGTIFDQTSQSQQANPVVQDNELFLNAKEKGSYIVIKPNNDIIIRTTDANGNKKGSIKITTDGNIILNEGTSPIARVSDQVSVIGATESGGTPSHTHDVNITGLISTGSGNTTN